MRCHVYERDAYIDDPVAPNWIRKDDLQGSSLFVGINYPFLFQHIGAAGDNADHAAQVFRRDCVFATHRRCHQVPQPDPDWCRMSLNGGSAIGSRFQYAEPSWGDIVETPMWLVPTVPNGI